MLIYIYRYKLIERKGKILHKSLVIAIILIIIGKNILSICFNNTPDKNSISFCNYFIEEKTKNNFQDNINLQDDAFHKTYNSFHIET